MLISHRINCQLPGTIQYTATFANRYWIPDAQGKENPLTIQTHILYCTIIRLRKEIVLLKTEYPGNSLSSLQKEN